MRAMRHELFSSARASNQWGRPLFGLRPSGYDFEGTTCLMWNGESQCMHLLPLQRALSYSVQPPFGAAGIRIRAQLRPRGPLTLPAQGVEEPVGKRPTASYRIRPMLAPTCVEIRRSTREKPATTEMFRVAMAVPRVVAQRSGGRVRLRVAPACARIPVEMVRSN